MEELQTLLEFYFVFIKVEREKESVTYGRHSPDISQRLIDRLGMLQVAVQSWNP